MEASVNLMLDIGPEAIERRVLVAARHGYLRVSPHFYNNEEDLDRLEQEFVQILKKL